MNINKKLMKVLLCFSCVACLTSGAFAISWSAGDTVGYWNVGTNWDSGTVPGSGDVTHVGNLDPNNLAVIPTGYDAEVFYLWLAYVYDGTVDMETGSSLTVGQNITVGRPYNGGDPHTPYDENGILNMYGDASIVMPWDSAALQVGSRGNGSLNLYGTSNIDVGWSLQVGANYGEGLGRVTLNDDSWIRCAYPMIMPNFDLGGPGTTNPNSGIDIRDNAELRLEGNWVGSAQLEFFITLGQITGDGIVGKVAYETVGQGVGLYTRVYVWPDNAVNPSPGNGANNVDPNSVLEWAAGIPAPTTGHDVYLGTDYNEVDTATQASHPNVVYTQQAGTVYDPDIDGFGDLAWGTTYYWRIDEVSGASIAKGDIWSFTTMDFYCDPPLAGDTDGDCKVNIVDLADVAADWLSCNAPRAYLCD